MPDRLEGRLRWLFGGVAVVLVAAGAYALLVTTHSAPAQAGFDAAATSLTAIAASAMMTMLALGALVVWSPRRRTHLMPVFALACGGASLALLAGALRASAAAAPVAPLLVAALAVLVLCIASVLGWLRLWIAPRPGAATAARDAALLDALLSTVVPEGQGLDVAANDVEVCACIERAFAARGARLPLLRIVLRVLDVLSRVRHRRSFALLDQDAREALYAGLATSHRARLRGVGTVIDEIVLRSFYGDARVRIALADDAGWIASRIDAGPNAEAHRVRREEAARAAVAALAAAAAQAEGAEQVAADLADDAALDPSEPGCDASDPSPVVAAPARPAVRERELARADDVPFDRAWTLGLPKEPRAPAAGSPVLRVARASGPTRR